MSEVTVQAMQPVLGLVDGAVVTVERSRRVDAAIAAGRLRVIAPAGDVEGVDYPPADPEPVAEPLPVAAESGSAKARGKRAPKPTAAPEPQGD